jgi:hypothetical protein
VLCALISLIGIFTLDAYAGGDAKGGPLLSAPFWLPYLFVILRVLRDRGKKLKSGLALAIAMGCAIFLPAAWLILYARSWDANWRIQAGLALVMLAQPVLVVEAIRSWLSSPREKGYWQIVIANGAYAAIALFILTSFLWHAPDRIAQDEERTLATMRSIQKADLSYARDFGVFPAHIAAFGAPADDQKPNCNGDNLLWLPDETSTADTFTTSGWSGGYVFQYLAGPPAQSSATCVGSRSFTLTARPVVFKKTGRSSFLMNQDYIVHATRENRSARSDDPPFRLPD